MAKPPVAVPEALKAMAGRQLLRMPHIYCSVEHTAAKGEGIASTFAMDVVETVAGPALMVAITGKSGIATVATVTPDNLGAFMAMATLATNRLAAMLIPPEGAPTQ